MQTIKSIVNQFRYWLWLALLGKKKKTFSLIHKSTRILLYTLCKWGSKIERAKNETEKIVGPRFEPDLIQLPNKYTSSAISDFDINILCVTLCHPTWMPSICHGRQKTERLFNRRFAHFPYFYLLFWLYFCFFKFIINNFHSLISGASISLLLFCFYSFYKQPKMKVQQFIYITNETTCTSSMQWIQCTSD